MRPRLLDLYCGAGGAAMGYFESGWDVVGIDNKPQPNYPFTIVHADALDPTRWRQEIAIATGSSLFDAVHASPPCQAYTAYRRKGHGVGDDAPDLISRTREMLRYSGLPYVIENVPRAPLIDPVLICGSMFDPPLDVRRHRLFETNWGLVAPDWPCRHKLQPTGRYPAATNRAENSRGTVEIGVWRIPLDVQRDAMGVDWAMTLEELSEAIPPAYTRYIGGRLLEQVGMTLSARGNG